MNFSVAVPMTEDSLHHRAVTVGLKNGLHMRPISQIAEVARKTDCHVEVSKDDVTVDASNVLDLMTLNAQFGTQLTLKATGEGSIDALDRLVELFEMNFEVDESSDP